MVKNIIRVFVLCAAGLCYASTASLKVAEINGISYSGSAIPDVFSGDIVSIIGWTDFPVRQIQAWSVNDNGDLRSGGSVALGMVSDGWVISGWEIGTVIAPRGANNGGWLYHSGENPSDSIILSGNDIAPYDKQGALWGFNYHVPSLTTSMIVTISCYDLTPVSGVSGAWDANERFLWDQVQLNIIPEPCSLVLLGLGCFIIVRRRK